VATRKKDETNGAGSDAQPGEESVEPQPPPESEGADPKGRDAAEVPAATQDAPEAAAGGKGEGAAGEPEQPAEEPAAEQPEEPEQPAEEPAAEQPEEPEQPAAEQPEEPDAEQPAEAERPPAEQSTAEREAAPAPLELAADARYSATGKRKSSIARVVLRPGTGSFDLNGRALDIYFPRRTLQEIVRQPLKATGYLERIDVSAKIHGGGVSSQADAVRHGIAKALIEAQPSLRGELKRRQLLTRDPRVKERRKAGLKKARKRPQFSKR
jgi:small subunit ribosomal protein S9